MKSFIKAFKEFSFSGRVSSDDYWRFFLVTLLLTVLIPIILILISVFIFPISDTIASEISLLCNLILLLPALSMQVKRLHDTGKSGNWIFLQLIPVIGAIILIVVLAKDGDAFENKYGPVPNGTKTETNEQVKDLALQPSINENVLCSSITEPLNFNELPEPPIETININSETLLLKEQKTPSRNNISKSTVLIIFAIALFLSIGANIYLFMQYKSSVKKINEIESDYEYISGLYDKANSEKIKLHFENVALKNKADFYDSYAAIVPVGSNTYHAFNCFKVNTMDRFDIYSYYDAQILGYSPCDKCNPPQ